MKQIPQPSSRSWTFSVGESTLSSRPTPVISKSVSRLTRNSSSTLHLTVRWLVSKPYPVHLNNDTTLGSLLRHGNQNRNSAFNGWSIPLPLSNAHCTTIRNRFLNGEIQLREKGTPAEIRARRDAKAHAMRQLRGL
jgi:hypothetical protein